MSFLPRPLFIFEMANNHQGDLEHGKQIIRAIAEECQPFRGIFDVAFKFQYRDLPAFIHPDYRESTSNKHIKRFLETALSEEHFLELKNEINACGFLSICTAFDEVSVGKVMQHDYDFIKIASCSVTDWPLLEKIAQYPSCKVIASTAGIGLEDVNSVAAFFQHRNIQLALMHCVAEYPTPSRHMELNQIDLFRKRYPKLTVGFSTHERPDDYLNVQLAVAKGARIFEKHVGMKYRGADLNAYSASPEQVGQWLASAKQAFDACGVEQDRHTVSEKERNDLISLQRGAFAAKPIKAGETVDLGAVFLAIPCQEGQVVANDLSKYRRFVATKAIAAQAPIYWQDVEMEDTRRQVANYVEKVRAFVKASGIPVPKGVGFELSHHYGLSMFDEFGVTIINCINREYCRKLLVSMPGQKHPTHIHRQKEETFCILYGRISVDLNGNVKEYEPGDSVLVERGVPHGFWSEKGAIIEEVSTTHVIGDSYYDDPKIVDTEKRKTRFTLFFVDGE